MTINKRENGSSLIEMVVALFVLAIGMLGVMSMQVKSMQFNQSAYYYSQAVYLANEILDSIRSNPEMANAYSIELDDEAPQPNVECEGIDVTCTPQELRDWSLSQWRKNIESTLVAGKSSIVNNGDFLVITVQFDDSRSELEESENPSLGEYVLVTEIN